MTQIQGGTGAAVVNLHYTWDAAGNVVQRRDANMGDAGSQGLVEDFHYDQLERLAQTDVDTGQTAIPGWSESQTYSKTGNILARSTGKLGAERQAYSYGDPGDPVHAAKTVEYYDSSGGSGTWTSQFDANGNVTHVRGYTLSWSSFNKPVRVQNSSTGVITRFEYGPDRSRYRQRHSDSSGSSYEERIYVGALYERVTETDGTTRHLHHIRAGGRTVAIRDVRSDTESSRMYLHRDHLSSVVAITDETGAVIERKSFEAWGKYRYDDGSGVLEPEQAYDLPTLAERFTEYGYTGHEHLKGSGFIHMNGRVYDPEIGRFLSPDPITQFPYSTQGYNRYAYVNNNPLSYNDPSGHIAGSLFMAFKLMSVKAAGWEMTSAIAAAVVEAALPTVFALEAAEGYLNTGSIHGAIQQGMGSVASAGMSFGIGNTDWGLVTKSLAHGVSQGAFLAARGGRFGDGALGAFAGHMGGEFTSSVAQGNIVAETVLSAVVGGSASKIGGGNFENGATTSAFVSVFNRSLHVLMTASIRQKRLLPPGIKPKDGTVNIEELDSRLGYEELQTIRDTYRKHGVRKDVVITSGNDGKRGSQSLHTKNMAIDTRSNFLSDSEQKALADDIQVNLGAEYTVVSEHYIHKSHNHIHIEIDRTVDATEAWAQREQGLDREF